MTIRFPSRSTTKRFGAGERPRILLVAAPAVREAMQAMPADFPGADIAVVPDELEAITEAVTGAHGMIGCPRPLFSDDLLRRAGDSLKWIHVPGAGVEEFIIPALVDSDITLTNGRVIQGPEVADHALALTLALTRNLYLILAGKAAGPVPRPVELRGKTLIVLGVGGIGMLVAERAVAFGMTVIGVDPDYVPMSCVLERTVGPEEIRDVLPLGDVVIMAAPHAPDSDPLMGPGEFAAMKKGAYFVNVSRGRTVDTAALTEALRSGHLGGAGLDVTDPEPLPGDHPLRSLDNVVLTPHIAGLSEHNRARSLELIRKNIGRFIANRPLINVVNKELGY